MVHIKHNHGIKEYCKENLADYKVPDRVDIVESLPIIPPGKVDKKLIKAKMIAEMGDKA